MIEVRKERKNKMYNGRLLLLRKDCTSFSVSLCCHLLDDTLNGGL